MNQNWKKKIEKFFLGFLITLSLNCERFFSDRLHLNECAYLFSGKTFIKREVICQI